MTVSPFKLQREVYIVDGARTPFLKAKRQRGPFSASDLATVAGRALLARQPFTPDQLDEVILGCVMPSENEANIGRLLALRLGCGDYTPGWTVQRNCASGMQALDSAVKDISMGRADLVLAGGTEAMSRAPLLFNADYVNWLGQWSQARTLMSRLKALLKLRPHFFAPTIALIRGLTDPVVEMNMAETAEALAERFNISRAEMDRFALRSHQRLAAAQDQGFLREEMVTLYDHAGNFYDYDDGIRRDSTVEKLAKVPGTTHKNFGVISAGNSSQITDGAAVLLLASQDAVRKYNLPVLGKVVDVQWAGLAPAMMGLGPVMAATPILQRHNLRLADIDYWEINEAFAAQVLACIRAWESEEFCRNELGLDKALGSLDEEKLNIDGGGVAQGHPVGASGARIVLHLLHVLERTQSKRGIASICIGGGQGGAMLVERV